MHYSYDTGSSKHKHVMTSKNETTCHLSSQREFYNVTRDDKMLTPNDVVILESVYNCTAPVVDKRRKYVTWHYAATITAGSSTATTQGPELSGSGELRQIS